MKIGGGRETVGGVVAPQRGKLVAHRRLLWLRGCVAEMVCRLFSIFVFLSARETKVSPLFLQLTVARRCRFE